MLKMSILFLNSTCGEEFSEVLLAVASIILYTPTHVNETTIPMFYIVITYDE